ncbi:related to HPP family protein [Cephalotrichum gorgonifer]|uniref:Related to HPP family protein n=1 Tax=Cephalotrichum gorgonifer TaxID=2041049 RepID=A0AAE8MRF5_9PEZI|nr:related to HPP family protein [Cephalotrichum gorgonifer]
MSYHINQPAGSSATTTTPATSTNSLAPSPMKEPDQPPSPTYPARSQRGGGPVDEEKGGFDSEALPDVVAQSSRTITHMSRRIWGTTFLEKLPRPVSHFLGYRSEPPKPVHPVAITFWVFIGVMSSLLLITLATQRIQVFRDNGAPVIVASFGAAAVLEFNSIASPFAQPRNALLSQIIASITGVCISKLFALAPNYDEIRWVGGALACALATVIMNATGNVHPPAGATALIAVVDGPSRELGWWMIPLVLLSCTIMIGVALLLNNVQRQFPMYWWAPKPAEEAKNGKKGGL